MASPPLTNIDLLNACDIFPRAPSSAHTTAFANYIHFRTAAHPTTTLGLMLPSVAMTFQHLPDWALNLEAQPRTLTLTAGNDAESRSAAMAKTTAAMRETGHFEILGKWRDELYVVYGPEGEEVLRLERACSQLFGVVTYGVHLTAFERENGLKIWVPRRAKDKQTFPGMLDNSVAGGISAGESAWDSLVRECGEEASLSPEVAGKAREVGAVTYFYVSGKNSGGEEGLLQPECQFVYDLDLSGIDVELKPNDDEVAGFELMNVARVKEALRDGEFKPNCALVMLDFLVRHGEVTPRNEKRYLEIVARLHRRLEFPIAEFAV